MPVVDRWTGPGYPAQLTLRLDLGVSYIPNAALAATFQVLPTDQYYIWPVLKPEHYPRLSRRVSRFSFTPSRWSGALTASCSAYSWLKCTRLTQLDCEPTSHDRPQRPGHCKCCISRVPCSCRASFLHSTGHTILGRSVLLSMEGPIHSQETAQR